METNSLIGIKTTVFFILLTVALSASGQNSTIPRNDFILSFSRNALALARGASDQLDITINKSKGYQKTRVKMGISSPLPKGVNITFDPALGSFDFTTATISVQSDATPGEYLLILNATLGSKTKGSIFKLLIR